MSPTIPDTMRALVHRAYGGPEVLNVETVPMPKIRRSEVLLKVRAAALNPVDWKMVNGLTYFIPNFIKTRPGQDNPAPVGFDVCGVVVDKGTSVDGLNVGDEVYGMAFFTSTGSIAEYFAIDQAYVAKKPEQLSHIDAASLPLAGLTTKQALFDHGNLKKGERVLILGGSGGTGSLAVQMAHKAGAYVLTTCSGRNEEFVRSLGADEVIDYTKTHFSEALKDQSLDMVYDCVGGKDSWDGSKKLLGSKGRYVTIVGDVAISNPTIADLLSKQYQSVSRGYFSWLTGNPKYLNVVTVTNSKDLQWMKKEVEDGSLKPLIDSVFALKDSRKAFEKIISHRARGKIVIDMERE